MSIGRRFGHIQRAVELVRDEIAAVKDDGAYEVACTEILETLRGVYNKLSELTVDAFRSQERAAAARKGRYSDAELRYAATARCHCGAGMAYHKDTGVGGSWECSDILTGRALPASHPESKEHTPELPFVFYKIKSEDQPSAGGATTRPKA